MKVINSCYKNLYNLRYSGINIHLHDKLLIGRQTKRMARITTEYDAYLLF